MEINQNYETSLPKLDKETMASLDAEMKDVPNHRTYAQDRLRELN